METANKRRGFLKNNLVKPLSRLAKSFQPAHGGASKVKPSPPAGREGQYEYHSMARKSMSSLPSTTPVQIGSVAKANRVLGSTIGYAQQSSYHSDDENVDLKATSYIYIVRQRLQSLEGVGSEGVGSEGVGSDQAYHP